MTWFLLGALLGAAVVVWLGTLALPHHPPEPMTDEEVEEWNAW